MKHWSLVVALVYCLILALCFPALEALAFPNKRGLFHFPFKNDEIWLFFLIIFAFGIAQFTMLRLPVAISKKRHIPQRSIHFTIISAAFMMALLIFGLLMGTLFLIVFVKDFFFVSTVLIIVIFWVFWSWYFYRVTSKVKAQDKVKKIQTYLWSGSALELIIALGVHITIRGRKTCCADWMNFIGIICGFAVMVFAFGPSLYFLIMARLKQIRPDSFENDEANSPSIEVLDENTVSFIFINKVIARSKDKIKALGKYFISKVVQIKNQLKAIIIDGDFSRLIQGMLLLPHFLKQRKVFSTLSFSMIIKSYSFFMALICLVMSHSIQSIVKKTPPSLLLDVLIAFISWLIFLIVFYHVLRLTKHKIEINKLLFILWLASLSAIIISLLAHNISKSLRHDFCLSLSFFMGLVVLIFISSRVIFRKKT
ncbi:hypothetical protein PQO03_12480 [Lentisphaera profundi]|uniref:Uncharacterized protein n=1 Tax=Lentisphaera profundi TaxID=1658616 RepID=A0ABY7W301_9BACT|nr:hypothetical protein [Lentisphaera profundi]WDE98653.1 hypothetical protein PQO03_12480 [Lentisphaera profundi]